MKVLPLRVGDTEMWPVLSDMVSTPIDLNTVEAEDQRDHRFHGFSNSSGS